MSFNVLPFGNQGISPSAPNTYRNQCSYLRSEDISTNSQTIDSYLNVNAVYSNQVQCDYMAINQNVSLSAQLEDELETLFTQNCVKGITAGSNITVDSTNPNYPIISATGGGGASFEGISVYLPNDLIGWTSADVIAPWSASLDGFYTNSNFNLTTGEYTVPETGKYLIDGNFQNQGGGASLYVNDILFYQGKGGDSSSTIITQEFQQGDVLTFKSNITGNIYKYDVGFKDGTILSITKVGGISTNDSFEGFNVHLDADQSVLGNTNIGNWAFDFNDAYFTSPNLNLTSGVYTVPTTGKYYIQFTNSASNAFIVVNDVQISTDTLAGPINQIINLTSGDTVSVQMVGDNDLDKLNNGTIATYWSMSLQGVSGGSGGIESIVAGGSIDVDNTDPANPIVSYDPVISTAYPYMVHTILEATYSELEAGPINVLTPPAGREIQLLSAICFVNESVQFETGDKSLYISTNSLNSNPLVFGDSFLTDLSSPTYPLRYPAVADSLEIVSTLPVDPSFTPIAYLGSGTSYTAGSIKILFTWIIGPASD